MRKITFLFSAMLATVFGASAQTVATFETLSLPTADTYYVNHSAPGFDVGFNNGLAHFPTVYDTSGAYWFWDGFLFSNKTDTVTSGLSNECSAKYGSGFGGSSKYAVCYGTTNVVRLLVSDTVQGFYVTNSTYAYNSMRDGDSYAKKFGDTTGTGLTTGQGTSPDWFKLTVRGYRSGALTTDSVEFYLADFRPAGTANDSIIKGWHWVNLATLGRIDSVQFMLSSSDTGFGYMNTPAYFCIDNFTNARSFVAVKPVSAVMARVYPNPANNTLFIDAVNEKLQQAFITDVRGSVVYKGAITGSHTAIDIAGLATGVYYLQLAGERENAVIQFVKQ